MANKKDPRYFPKQFRGKPRAYIPRFKDEPPPPPPPRTSVHWVIAVMLSAAVLIAVSAIVKAIR